MERKFTYAVLACLLAVAAFATEYELKWDDGTLRYLFYVTGPDQGVWLGNDFDTATLAAYNINRLRFAVQRGPNGVWDGCRLAIWSFNGVPASIIWPISGTPQYVLPTFSTNWGWLEAGVNWTLPGGRTAFLAAQEQYYNYPNIDNYCLDGLPPSQGHTWYRSVTTPWSRFSNYGDLMMRAFVRGAAAVTPSSLGRVKALFR